MNILYPISIGAAISILLVSAAGKNAMSKNNQRSASDQAEIGFLWGAVVGSIISVPAFLAFLFYLLKDDTRGGDSMVGGFGFIIIAIPLGFIIGGITGRFLVPHHYKDKKENMLTKDAQSKDAQSVGNSLAWLGICLLAAVDSGATKGITPEIISVRIEDGSIIKFIEDKFPEVKRAMLTFSDDDKHRLLGEWQSYADTIDAESDMNISVNGINVLVSYAFQGVRGRLDGKTAWPFS